MYTYTGASTQEWSGYRNADCALVIYNGDSDDVLTASPGTHCIRHFADCVSVEPYSLGDRYQEWTRDIYGNTWVIRPVGGGVDEGKAISDPLGRDIPSTPVVLALRHDTRANQQWATVVPTGTSVRHHAGHTHQADKQRHRATVKRRATARHRHHHGKVRTVGSLVEQTRRP